MKNAISLLWFLLLLTTHILAQSNTKSKNIVLEKCDLWAYPIGEEDPFKWITRVKVFDKEGDTIITQLGSFHVEGFELMRECITINRSFHRRDIKRGITFIHSDSNEYAIIEKYPLLELRDSDDDGISDIYDDQPYSPRNMFFEHGGGRSLDSDGDGYPDTEDDEPFTIMGSAVDRNGVAIDTDSDGVPDILDKEPNSPPGFYYDVNGVAIQLATVNDPLPCSFGFNLPISAITFEFDSDEILPEFYSELYQISRIMMVNPLATVVVTGFADHTGSDDLALRRATKVSDFISDYFGIARSRFSIATEEDASPIRTDLPNSDSVIKDLQFLHNRVELELRQN